MRRCAAGALAMLAAGCGAGEQIRFDAQSKCMALVAESLGVDLDDSALEDEKAELGGVEQFRFLSSGEFVAEFRDVRFPGRSGSTTFTCVGSVTERLVTSIQIDGVLTRPTPPPANWKF